MAEDKKTTTVLDSESLVRKFGNRKFSLPAFGEKCTGLEDSWRNYDDQIETLLTLREEPRVNQNNHLTEAVWNEEWKSVKIVKPVGKHWNFMGHKQLLCPEEALFLLESNQMNLKHGGVNVSIQKAYEMLISSSPEYNSKKCTLNAYRVYSHFVKLGYKVVRHSKKDLNINLAPQKDKRIIMSDSKQDEVQVTYDNRKELTIVGKLNDISKLNDRRKLFNSIPNCYGQSQLKLTVPPSRLLPPNSIPSKSEYIFHVPQSPMVSEQSGKDRDIKQKRSSAFGSKRRRGKTQKSYLRINPFCMKRKSAQASLDTDDKKKSEINLTIGLDEGPLASLWKSKTKPLLQPKDAWTTKAIRSKLNLTEVEILEEEGSLEILFDLYCPNTKYSKSNPQKPNYRIALSDSISDRVPREEEVISAVKHLNDNVPLLFAVCTAGSVSFYNFLPVNLPSLEAIG